MTDVNAIFGTREESDELTKTLAAELIGKNAGECMGALTRVTSACVRVMGSDATDFDLMVLNALACTHISCILDVCDKCGVPSEDIIRTIQTVRASKEDDADE